MSIPEHHHRTEIQPSAECENFLLLLWEMELTKALLYDEFGSAFPLHAREWAGFAEMKRSYSQSILAWKGHLQNRMITAAEQLPLETVSSFIRFMEHLLLRARKTELNLRQAAHQALAVEKISLDFLLRRHFICSSTAAREIACRLGHAVRQQRAVLLRLLDDIDAGLQPAGTAVQRQYSNAAVRCRA